MHGLKSLVLGALPLAASAAWMPSSGSKHGSKALSKRQATSAFKLYAYGDSVGGLNLFSTGDATYIGDASTFNSTTAASIIFTPQSTTWTASPDANTTLWGNVTFAVPSPSASSHEVKVVNTTSTDDYETDGFNFYGHVAIFVDASGNWMTEWYATPVTGTKGVYQLNWNKTAADVSSSDVLVTLKDTAPSTDSE